MDSSAGVNLSPSEFVAIDLDIDGNLLYPNGITVPEAAVAGFIERRIRVPRTATDIIVYVHGWRTSPARAHDSAKTLARGVKALWLEKGSAGYGNLNGFKPHFVLIRWVSHSPVSGAGFAAVRERAHAMSYGGKAAEVIGAILGYLNATRTTPPRGETRLRTIGGQYLHCVGHSFGGRFLGEAIGLAAQVDRRPPKLGWPWRNNLPFGVDSLVVFQMAAAPDIFDNRLSSLLNDAPLHGPIVLTHTLNDRALTLWHALAQGTPGIGAVGARLRNGAASSLKLRPCEEAYEGSDFAEKIVNVDATWRFKAGRFIRFEGAHSSHLVPESYHLLLSLANLSR